MLYSCAIYRQPTDSLAQAQQNKLETLLLKARPTAHSVLLEIGCGWGSFALYAAARTGCSVVGITLSAEQHKFAQQRLGVAAAEVKDRVWFECVDYRLFQAQPKYFVHRLKHMQQQLLQKKKEEGKAGVKEEEDLKFDAIVSCEMVCWFLFWFVLFGLNNE